jgi:hypothetical protein
VSSNEAQGDVGCKNAYDAYTLTKGWNDTARLYRSRPEILNGIWKFPEPRSAG